ncbi:DUF3482 domain-containing protein [Ramlibacter sp. MMS24-I3-19]|uniref:DUF3482 domain-containing protein n=1 Tax=Ramlibacter sp. MMS24-I3-19 TaxID=3416606 RepID=UPI003CFC02DB
MPTDDLTPDRLLLPEAAARRLLLVQAIDQVDTQGRLVGTTERERIEQDALAATGDPGRGQAVDARAWLLARADRLLDLVSHRQPRLAALAQQPSWQHWAGWLLPLLALVLGGFIDRIDNPKQVNLLSPPLLAFVLWNLTVYLILLVMAFWPHRKPRPPSSSSWLSQLLERRTGGLRGDVAKAFGLAWFRHAGPLEGQRWRRIMHTCAAAWAVGVALSIVAGGLVREYRVGWESTLLDLPQVHALLRALFAPVVALLPIEPFSQAELARLHFGSGIDVGRLEARRWVGLYVALLGVLVVLPRTLLALWAAFGQYRLSRAIAIDLRTPDFVALLGRIRPARVRLGVHVLPGADAQVLQVVLSQAGAQANPHPPAGRWTVLDTPRGDVLVCEPWLPAGAAPFGVQGWLARFRARAEDHGAEAPDVVLVLGDATALAAAVAPLKAAATPVLWMSAVRGAEGPATALRGAGLRVAIVPLTDLPTWHEDAQLRDTIGPLLPRHMAPGWNRLSALWSQHAHARLGRAMHAVAEELLACARDTQPLEVQPLGVRQLVVRGERDASEAARQVATAALVARVRERQQATDRHLLALHGVDAGQAAIDHALPGEVRVHHAVDEAQSGLAGAASGAAMGAAVDLMTGGLTLGAASALGALVGGGAALVAAAWKNRAGQPGASLVMLDERVLLGLVDLALLRYLRVAHAGREVASDAGWQDAVRNVTEAQRSELRELLAQARSAKEGDGAAGTRLADALGRLAQQALVRLHGQRS